jgi:hypothetical protein
MTIYAYAFEPEQFAKLQQINKELFGDGTSLTPDRRRDLANLMHLILNAAQPLDAADGESLDALR